MMGWEMETLIYSFDLLLVKVLIFPRGSILFRLVISSSEVPILDVEGGCDGIRISTIFLLHLKSKFRLFFKEMVFHFD